MVHEDSRTELNGLWFDQFALVGFSVFTFFPLALYDSRDSFFFKMWAGHDNSLAVIIVFFLFYFSYVFTHNIVVLILWEKLKTYSDVATFCSVTLWLIYVIRIVNFKIIQENPNKRPRNMNPIESHSTKNRECLQTYCWILICYILYVLYNKSYTFKWLMTKKKCLNL